MHVFLQRQMKGFLAIACACFMLALPFVAKADLATCRTCMDGCHRQYPSDTVEVCFAACNHAATGRPCQGIAIRDVSSGFGSAQSGAGRRSSRVQGTTTNPTGAATETPAPTGNCVDAAVTARRLTAEEAAAIVGRSGRPSSEFSCQRTCTDAQRNNCVRGGCPGTEAAILCCPPGGGIATGDRCGARGTPSAEGGAQQAGGTTPAGSAGTGSPSPDAAPAAGSSDSSGSGSGSIAGRLELPACIETGNCQVADLLNTGLNAIRFMFGLAGALLLVVFVYAGIQYLLADTFGSVKAAKESLQKAVTGIAIMFFGYTLVKFLVNLFIR